MYKLIQEHTFISYLGLIIVILTVAYLSILALYFTVDFFVVNNEVFECSNMIWMMIRSAELVLSMLFLIIGFVISKILKKIQIVYRKQVAKKEKELWVLIGVSLLATMTSFIESVVYITEDYSQCFMMISGQLGFSIGVFCFLRFVTDYSVMSTVIYQFWKTEMSRGISIDMSSDEEILTFVDRDATYNSLTGHDV
ncbi:hypothetical protein SteCoe_13808 [Stentor coeruleus]|uniref:Uncharacterized protein n=1 Tax=Stentor coeruleus TaxID=5963 RepID=A0A1R2C7H6_9CILI|nr:hypothetical protein SteCoe_13808 [Stentor coeruleus]